MAISSKYESIPTMVLPVLDYITLRVTKEYYYLNLSSHLLTQLNHSYY